MLLINYDTEDTTVVISRERCECGRTHMRIVNPEREAETIWVEGNTFNRVDIEAAVFQPENMAYLTGEYEAFVDPGNPAGQVTLNLGLECPDTALCDRHLVEDCFIQRFFRHKRGLGERYQEGSFGIRFTYAAPGDLEMYRNRGRPRRLIDRRRS
jgi:phenylacetate-coenzyme A ligase PaaK-like adenylate-forming protein